MGLSGQEWVGGVPVVLPDTVGIVSADGASWGRTEGSQWWAGSGSEGFNTMPHSQQHQAKYCKVIIAAKDSNASLNHFKHLQKKKKKSS